MHCPILAVRRSGVNHGATPDDALTGIGWIMKHEKYGWGIWLKELRVWAELPDRMCKPTPYNCDLVPELIQLLRKLSDDGHEPELKMIPSDQLREWRKNHKE